MSVPNTAPNVSTMWALGNETLTVQVTSATLMLNASLILANVTPPVTSAPAQTKPAPNLPSCIPEQLVNSFSEAQLAQIMNRTGLEVCKPNETAVVPKNRDSVLNYSEYHVARWIIIYRYYILLPVAVIFNGLLLITVAKRMTERSSYFNMGMLAIWDTLTIILRSMHNILLREGVLIGLEGCRFFDFLGGAAGIVANWILVAWTIERALVVTMPLRFAAVQGIKTAVICNIVIVVVTIGIKLRTLIVNGYTEFNKKSLCLPPEDKGLSVAFTWVDGLAYSIVPLILVVVFNCLIILGLARASANRESLKEGYAQKSAGPSKRSAYQQRQVTIMLMVASIIFALLTVPTVVYFALGMAHADRQLSPKESASFLLGRTVTQLLTDINHCINFFLYVLASRAFRRDLQSLCCGGEKARSETVNSTGSTAISSRKISTRL